MSKKSPKAKPWVPPPARYLRRDKRPPKPQTETTSTAATAGASQVNNKEICDADDVSVNSDLPLNTAAEFDIFIYSIKEEIRLLNVHFATLKTSSQSVHRLFGSLETQDLFIKELLDEIYVHVKDFNYAFEDVEYSVAVLENAINEESKMEELIKVVKFKKELLTKFLDTCDKVMIVFGAIVGKLKEPQTDDAEKEILKKQLQQADDRIVSLEAIIKDFERRLSILQGKANSLESYNVTLEEAKSDLQKQVTYKEAQIKYLNAELMKASSNKDEKYGHEELIKVLEEMKNKAQAEKSALKKAIKLQKLVLDKIEKQLENAQVELKEKDKMLFDIATQRDKLKVQLTVVNNTVIDLKTQYEELKNQNQKLQSKLDGKEPIYEKELKVLKDSLEEKSVELDKVVRKNQKLEKIIKDLNDELEMKEDKMKSFRNRSEDSLNIAAISQMQNLGDFGNAVEEIKKFSCLLQETKELFQKLKPSHAVSSEIDQVSKSGNSENILAALQETNAYLSEFKHLYNRIPEEQKGMYNRKELEERLNEVEKLYDASVKENETLKSEIEEMKSGLPTSFMPVSQKKNSAHALHNEDFTRKLQLELMLKNDELLKLKYEFQQRESELEHQLKETKGMLQKQEIENMKSVNIEEELKAKKLELSLLEQKKEEETERLLRRAKELQESLDATNADYERLQRYVQTLKSSYLNVFADS